MPESPRLRSQQTDECWASNGWCTHRYALIHNLSLNGPQQHRPPKLPESLVFRLAYPFVSFSDRLG
ncbi:hypothetical protein HETIRDRAFT_104710 [Heterobasidion irregulare TC 32-1]|uniref:Uncharacterized protein n=1 Tax=Heterobasidion irregulare (strain TC 32-1) TaxID=747525 RepID=W4K8G5_HETIT|nr:uncharacterized protein HETIRDRAFT_104710 [Heterobasidion irregulare TC 32-1]ETW81341.1 hypothetical protein HETIRDRAFT_104710 [Heterobasidion irregulare TC 32-1]